MVTVGLLVRLTAKPGKERKLELVESEPATPAWLAGSPPVLMERAADLLAAAPDIEPVDTLAAKLPADSRD